MNEIQKNIRGNPINLEVLEGWIRCGSARLIFNQKIGDYRLALIGKDSETGKTALILIQPNLTQAQAENLVAVQSAAKKTRTGRI